jgi:hypothetical protein
MPMKSATDDLGDKGKAYHEAGHVIFQFLFKKTLIKVSILPQGGDVGGVSAALNQHPLILRQIGAHFTGTVAQDKVVCHDIMISQAGEVAQTLFCPQSVHFEAARDDRVNIERHKKRLRNYTPLDRAARIEELEEFTRQLLNDPLCIAYAHAIAQALLERKELSGEEVKTMMVKAKKEATLKAKESGQPPPNIICPHCANYPDDE